MQEIFQVINDYPRYEISNFGRVRSKVKHYQNDYYLKPRKASKGHLYVDLYLGTEGWEKNRFYIHRLVCNNFLPNPDNLPNIDHIDRNPENNNISNLRWVSYSTNSINKKAYSNTGKRCISLQKDGRYLVSVKMTMERPIKKYCKDLDTALEIRNQIIRDNNIEWRDDYDN